MRSKIKKYFWITFCPWVHNLKQQTKCACHFNILFFKKWANPGLFFVYFHLFKQTLQFLQQINVKKCPSSIRRQDSNSQPSDFESPPLTTRPRLPPNILSISYSHPLFISVFNLMLDASLNRKTFSVVRDCTRGGSNFSSPHSGHLARLLGNLVSLKLSSGLRFTFNQWRIGLYIVPSARLLFDRFGFNQTNCWCWLS